MLPTFRNECFLVTHSWAMSRAVRHLLLVTVTWILSSSKRWVKALRCEYIAAKCRGVFPAWSTAFMCFPSSGCLSIYLTAETLPYFAATWRTVLPRPSGNYDTRCSFLICSTSPNLAAIWMGRSPLLSRSRAKYSNSGSKISNTWDRLK